MVNGESAKEVVSPPACSFGKFPTKQALKITAFLRGPKGALVPSERVKIGRDVPTVQPRSTMMYTQKPRAISLCLLGSAPPPRPGLSKAGTARKNAEPREGSA